MSEKELKKTVKKEITFTVLKKITIDKEYLPKEKVTLSDEKTINKLISLNYIK